MIDRQLRRRERAYQKACRGLALQLPLGTSFLSRPSVLSNSCPIHARTQGPSISSWGQRLGQTVTGSDGYEITSTTTTTTTTTDGQHAPLFAPIQNAGSPPQIHWLHVIPWLNLYLPRYHLSKETDSSSLS